jgi:hypothetical protein
VREVEEMQRAQGVLHPAETVGEKAGDSWFMPDPVEALLVVLLCSKESPPIGLHWLFPRVHGPPLVLCLQVLERVDEVEEQVCVLTADYL